MNRIIETLKKDHRQMAALLAVMEDELSRFEKGDVLDYTLLTSILDFLSRTSQLEHHFVEDKIFDVICDRNPDKSVDFGDIRLEHEKLAFLCNAFREALDNVEQDNEVPRVWLVSVAQEYLVAQKRHMRMEETVLFPAAQIAFTASDWDALKVNLARLESDPFVFEEKRDLEELRQDILSWCEDSLPSN